MIKLGRARRRLRLGLPNHAAAGAGHRGNAARCQTGTFQKCATVNGAAGQSGKGL
jgi:hypothetical protein